MPNRESERLSTPEISVKEILVSLKLAVRNGDLNRATQLCADLRSSGRVVEQRELADLVTGCKQLAEEVGRLRESIGEHLREGRRQRSGASAYQVVANRT